MLQINLLGAEQAKIYGISLVEFNGEGFVKSMREIARNLLKENDYITIDDLRVIADKYDITPHHQNAWGSIFRSKEFEACGMQKSEIVSNHARRILQWRMRNERS